MSDKISDGSVQAALRRHMTIQAARQVISASNLANIDTPGFKAKQIDFDRALDDSLGNPAAATITNAKHVQAGPDRMASATSEVEGVQARRDGNTVQVDRELLEMSSAAGEFARAQTALAAKFRLVKYAIAETR